MDLAALGLSRVILSAPHNSFPLQDQVIVRTGSKMFGFTELGAHHMGTL